MAMASRILLLPTEGSNTVSIRLGDGLGGFSGTTDVSVGNAPHSVAIGDFNNDGKQDFAVANIFSSTQSRSAWEMDQVALAAPLMSAWALVLVSVAIGDFNNDGKQDFAAAKHQLKHCLDPPRRM